MDKYKKMRTFVKMPRKLTILPILMSMLMVLFTTMVPHHHHQAMICLAKEVCELDGCHHDGDCDHSDADQEEEENHCVSREKYCPSDNLRLDIVPPALPVSSIPQPDLLQVRILSQATRCDLPLHSPPLLSWRLNC